MGVRLRPLDHEEAPSFVAHAKEGYVTDMVANAGMTETEAREKAETDFETLAPDDRPSPGQLFFWVEDEESGMRVGRAWLAERFGDRSIAFVHDLEIDPAFRGSGLGRAAMLELEDEAKRRGLVEIRLNVFGGNDVARSLYRSLGYDEFAIGMRKRLG